MPACREHRTGVSLAAAAASFRRALLRFTAHMAINPAASTTTALTAMATPIVTPASFSLESPLSSGLATPSTGRGATVFRKGNRGRYAVSGMSVSAWTDAAAISCQCCELFMHGVPHGQWRCRDVARVTPAAATTAITADFRQHRITLSGSTGSATPVSLSSTHLEGLAPIMPMHMCGRPRDLWPCIEVATVHACHLGKNPTFFGL